MALTPEQIDAEAFARWGEMKGAPLAMCRGFARAIEAEVRKDDEALIRQMLEALDSCDPGLYMGTNGSDKPYYDARKVGAAIANARARLAPPPPTA